MTQTINVTNQSVKLSVQQTGGETIVSAKTVGIQGGDGKSAYQTAVQDGYVGTEADFSAGLISGVTSANDSQVAALAAKASEDAAFVSETDALASANLAADWAEGTLAPGGVGTKSSKTHATEAGVSAGTATSKAGEAATSASEAAGSATLSGSHSTAAGAAKDAAIVAQGASEVARDGAVVARTGAETAETNASGSATTSANWAESATAPGVVGTKSAKTHATEASGSASVASTKATEASNSAAASLASKDASVVAQGASETARDASVAARAGSESARDLSLGYSQNAEASAAAALIGQVADGTDVAPGLSFTNDTDTGISRPAINEMSFSTGSVRRALLSGTALTLDVPLNAGDISGTTGTFSGNVGIGTSNPQSKVEIIGGNLGNIAGNESNYLRAGGTSVNGDDLVFKLEREVDGTHWDTAAHSIQRVVDVSPRGFLRFGSAGQGPITLGNGATEYLRMDDGGKIGLGTKNPQARLHIADTNGAVYAGNSQYQLDSGTGNEGAIYLGGPVSNPTAGIEASWGGAANPQLHMGVTRDGRRVRYSAFFDNTLRMYTNNAERLRVDNDGKLLSSGGLAFVGTVSSGAAFGAIIQRGVNANGTFVRFADGTQICTHVINNYSTITNAAGNIFTSGEGATWSFPAAFAIAPFVSGSARSTGEVWINTRPISSTQGVARLFAAQSTTGSVIVEFGAIGRWF